MNAKPPPNVLDRHFGLSANGTSVPTELRAGLATFLTMAYILFVNPAILEKAGMDHGAVFVATALAAAAGSLIMGLYANYPIALAPGMGLNAFRLHARARARRRLAARARRRVRRGSLVLSAVALAVPRMARRPSR